MFKAFGLFGIILLLFLFIMPWQRYFYNTPSHNNADSTAVADTVQEILTYAAIDSVLNLFEQTTYENMDKEYLIYAGYTTYSKSELMKGRTFYKIQGADTLIPLVGHYRIGEFLPRDHVHYKDIAPDDARYFQYLCLDKRIIYRFLDLILLLRKNGYTDDFSIKDGYRYPSFNNRTGGATYSQHIYGLAIDIYINDVDKDGYFIENKDKKIVYDYLDKDIIKNTGGIGRYPGSTVVHFDIRGHKARWDNQ
ncbi:MAG: Peptidase M15 [Bacteroidetes bacterium ADurb.Bin408]|nr:MAG: Peptidase M15 [Bacteroidetes bacterium ADurb.Bin408]